MSRQKDAELPVPSHSPVLRDEANVHGELPRCTCTAIEGPHVPLFPEHPTDQEHDGVKPAPEVLVDALPIGQPPLHERLRANIHIRQVKPVHPGRPDLAAVRTAQQDVINCVWLLVAGDASVCWLKAMAVTTLAGPASILQSQRIEEADTGGAAVFHNCAVLSQHLFFTF